METEVQKLMYGSEKKNLSLVSSALLTQLCYVAKEWLVTVCKQSESQTLTHCTPASTNTA